MAVSMLVYMRARQVPEAVVRLQTPAAPLRTPQERASLVNGLFQGALRDAPDGQDFAETPSYRRLLFHVRTMPAEDFSSRVAGRLDWQSAVEQPEAWRGEFVRVRGLVASLEAVKLQGQDAGLEDVYRGFIGQHDGSETVVFDFVDRPPNVSLNKDVLDIEGVFYRTVKYESRAGTDAEVPYLIARKVTLYTPPADEHSPLVVALQVLGVVVGSIVAALLITRWGARRRKPPVAGAGSEAGIRELFEARLREGGDPTRNGPQAS